MYTTYNRAEILDKYFQAAKKIEIYEKTQNANDNGLNLALIKAKHVKGI